MAHEMESLASIGLDQIGYVRPITGEQAKEIFADAPENLLLHNRYFALLAADGSPLMLTDTVAAAFGKARLDDLQVTWWH